MDTYLIPDCGICDQPHPCHCPRVRWGCPSCCPIPATAVRNLAAAAVAALPAVSEYAKKLGYVPESIRQRIPRSA